VSGPETLDLLEAGVAAIVWCTGVSGDFGWLRVPVLDGHGTPLHDGGVSTVPGLYFLGFPWLRRRKSGIILGIAEDAERIAAEVGRQLTS
jgi:putative flavoprotein involved in K+ transport